MPSPLAAASASAHHAALLAVLLAALAVPPSTVTAYVARANSQPAAHTPSPSPSSSAPTSSLASKVIFQSPAMENVYRELVASSKPLHLRKYATGGRVKKTKKESKIYYIPIPPMPYRYIPGVGYDYQPVRINPILQEVPVPVPVSATAAPSKGAGKRKHGNNNYSNSYSNSYSGFGQQQSQYGYGQRPQNAFTSSPNNYGVNNNSNNNNYNHSNSTNKNSIKRRKDEEVNGESSTSSSSGSSASESKVIRMDRGNYFFNGRPFRLQVAHAKPRNRLTPQNLKSKLYFNKNIIY